MRPGAAEATCHPAVARFTLAPLIFLATALLALVEVAPSSARGYVWFNPHRIALVAVATLLIENFSFESERSLGPGGSPA